MKKIFNLFVSSIIILYCFQSTRAFAGQAHLADAAFKPEIPKFKGCCAKRVAPVDTNYLQGIKKKTLNNQQLVPRPKVLVEEILNVQVKDKIISLSPAITEIIYALDAGDELVAVSDFCTYPSEVKSKPVVGGFINPSFERILTFRPDLVIYQGFFSKIKKFCHSYKIPTCNVQLDDWNSITNSIQQIGNKIGCSKKAAKLRSRMVSKLKSIRKSSTNKKPVPVLFCVGRENGPVASCTTIGKESFINEMLKVAGGSNVCEDVIGTYPTISAEVISSRQPEIIFDLRPAQQINKKQIIREWKILNKKSKIVVLTNDFLMVPGPRITKIAEEFKKYLTK